MEFNLHMITNGTQAQINIECSSKDKIDRDKLKSAVYEVIDAILDGSNEDFVPPMQSIIKDINIHNEQAPVKTMFAFGNIPPKYDGPLLSPTNKKQNSQNDSILVKNSFHYLPYIVSSQIACIKSMEAKL